MTLLQLRVASASCEAKDVMRVELAAADGGELPPFTPGAHLALSLANGMQRQYSLVNDWRERHRYVLGVGLAPNGRGGSAFVHAQFRPGIQVESSLPVNNFALEPDAQRYLFIAGGIGVTPILAMVQWCEAGGKPWKLVYATRSRVRLAFYETLAAFGTRVKFHCDDDSGGPLNVKAVMADVSPGTHVYCCGPAPLMEAVQQAGGHLGPDGLHFEWFSAPASDGAVAHVNDDGFWIDLKQSGRSLHVPGGQSILEVLEQSGYELPFSCREGVCGTCETTVCAGEPDHRDYVYSPAQREGLRTMLICVSRARSPRLQLDL